MIDEAVFDYNRRPHPSLNHLAPVEYLDEYNIRHESMNQKVYFAGRLSTV